MLTLGLHGELGEAVTTKTGVPVRVPGVERVKQIAAAAHNGLALLEDGAVLTWGARGCAIVLQPEMFDPNDGFSARPVAVPGLRGVRSLALRTTFFVLRDGTLLVSGGFLPSQQELYKAPTVIVKAPER